MSADELLAFEIYWNSEENRELRRSCAKGWALRIWQDSRAAIEVELPSDVGETLGGEYYYCHDVVKTLESLGLKVKP